MLLLYFVLAQNCGLSSLLGLLRWIRCHKYTTQTVVAICGSPWLEAALAALHQPQSCVRYLHVLEDATNTSLQSMAVYPGLRQCTPKSPAVKPLSLQPLQNLPHLQVLALRSGSHSGLEAATRLTSLVVEKADVKCAQNCLCVMSLVRLDLRQSTLVGLHNDGLAACSCLASLSCFSSAVCASEQHAAIARHNGDDCASIPSLR